MLKKKIITLLLLTTLISSTTLGGFTPITSYASTDIANISIQSIDEENKEVTFNLGQDTYSYNADTETLIINDSTYIQFETTIEYIDPELGITKEEALANEKERTFKNITGDKTENINTRSNYIPSNAPYVVAINFSRKITDIYGSLGDGLGDISAVTTALTLTPGIPGKVILGKISALTGLSSWAISKTKGYVGGEWRYTQHRTRDKYQYYSSYQYGYRYAQEGLSLNLRFNGKTYNAVNVSSNSIGGWWVTQKPW